MLLLAIALAVRLGCRIFAEEDVLTEASILVPSGDEDEEVEVDVETGKVTLIDYLGVGDVGTVINPRSLLAQIKGGSCLGIAHALQQKWAFDPKYGVMVSRRFHQTKPLTILDIPANMQAVALDMPDPETPVGARGVGEPPVGAGYGGTTVNLKAGLGSASMRT